MRIFVDIDDTICYYNDELTKFCLGRDYSTAIPNYENIAKINKLYDEGNQITYWTARGNVTGIDWTETTRSQLESWNCKYDKLRVGDKPAYELLICDKTKRIEEI
jgi:CMP-N,N'-diacetyllegionaminic acid synthase